MQALYEFMMEHRGELLRVVRQKVQGLAQSDTSPEQEESFGTYFDQVIAALRASLGQDAKSPLPDHSEAASDVGERQRRAGMEPQDIPKVFGALSMAVGEVAGPLGLSFDAAEYGMFNTCTDIAIAEAIQSYWTEERLEAERQNAAFVGQLAHELRNELWTARMAFGQLRQAPITIGGRTGDMLGRSLGRMEGLISQAMVLAQLEAGSALVLRRISLSALLRDLRDGAYPGRDVQLMLEVVDGLTIMADERLLASAVGNLIHNALKFTRARGTVKVRAKLEGDHFVVEVADECGGLPPGKADELFRPFTQRGTDRSGLGLGLSISQAAVAAHQGSLVVRNEPGHGCVFILRQPVEPAL